MADQPKPWRDLGCLNGLRKMPKALRDCRAQNHPNVWRKVRRYLEEYSCKTCRIRYRIDLSD